MRKQFLEAGKILNTHGVRGEVKIQPWTDSPSFLCKIKTLYIDSTPVSVVSARVHNGIVISKLDGYDSIDDSLRLKNKIVFLNRDDVTLEEGSYFLQDLIGLKAISVTGDDLGVMDDILELPAGNVYVIKGAREILVPANDEFVREVNIDGGYIKFSLIEGM